MTREQIAETAKSVWFKNDSNSDVWLKIADAILVLMQPATNNPVDPKAEDNKVIAKMPGEWCESIEEKK